MEDGKQLVNDYLEALARGDLGRVREVLTDDFRFTGPMMETVGRESYLEEAAGAFEFVQGVEMRRQWTDGDELCSIYELAVKTPAAETSMLMSEWNTVSEGRLASSTLIFDTSVHDTLMPDGHDH